VIPGKTPQKKQTMIYYSISKIYPKKLGQAIGKIFEWLFDIFWCSPTSSTSGGGRLCQGGKEKFVRRLGFRRARNS
jgi:hypothetical protein